MFDCFCIAFLWFLLFLIFLINVLFFNFLISLLIFVVASLIFFNFLCFLFFVDIRPKKLAGLRHPYEGPFGNLYGWESMEIDGNRLRDCSMIVVHWFSSFFCFFLILDRCLFFDFLYLLFLCWFFVYFLYFPLISFDFL